MDTLIEDFCFNNNAPSDEIVQGVRKMLAKPLQDLKDLDLEICTLEQRLQDLKSKQNDDRKWIARYQSILSPIRTIPPDVLGEIFQHCLSFHTNPVLKSTECPLILTRVCTLWRDIALSRPGLWSRIHIAFTELDPSASPSGIEGQAILQQRSDAVKQWLSQAGTRPLSLSIYFEGKICGPEPSPTTMELLEFLSQLSPRFEDLELTMPLEIFRRLESMIDISQMTSLMSLKILSLSPQTRSRTIGPILMLRAPNLRQVSTLECDARHWGISEPLHVAAWSRLTSISCKHWFSKDETISLLTHTENLVHLAISIFDRPVRLRAEPALRFSRISLPFLRTLLLGDSMTDERRGDLYERIDAPGLRYINFSTTSGPHWSNRMEPILIMSLLRQAAELEKLWINPLSMKVWDMESIFKAVPTLTHLFIGSEGRDANGIVRKAQLECGTEPRPFDFQLLSLNIHPPLLPNLQSFEINTNLILIKDEDLLCFVKSRMSPTAGTRVSGLKHLAAVFYRLQERDLVEEIRQHAENIAVDMIDLALYFETPPPEPEEKTKVPEPEFGLVTKVECDYYNQDHVNIVNYCHFHRLDWGTLL